MDNTIRHKSLKTIVIVLKNPNGLWCGNILQLESTMYNTHKIDEVTRLYWVRERERSPEE